MESENIKDNEYQNLAGSLSKSPNVNEVLFDSEHKLNSSWSFWYASRKQKDHLIPYENRLKKFAQFSSVENFFKYYVYIKSASEIDRNTDISLFKNDYKPLWESCPNSGIIFVRYKKHENLNDVDLKWEKLLFALIGEQFDEESILGSTLSIRGRETIIELWFDYQKNNILKVSLIEKFKELLEFDKSIIVYFKDNSLSIQDKSTLKNVETVVVNNRKNTYF